MSNETINSPTWVEAVPSIMDGLQSDGAQFSEAHGRLILMAEVADAVPAVAKAAAKRVDELVGALEAMLEVFDHPGLRGLVLNAKKSGWTDAHVNEMVRVCAEAARIVREARP